MGRNIGIDMTFGTPLRVVDVVGSMLKAGWSAAWEGRIRYMVADFEWKASEEDALTSIEKEMERDLSTGEVVGISIFWRDGGCGGNLLFYEDRTSVSFVPELNRRPLAGVEEFTDLGWYLERLVPPLREVGLVGIVARDEP